jgi:protein gp37
MNQLAVVGENLPANIGQVRNTMVINIQKLIALKAKIKAATDVGMLQSDIDRIKDEAREVALVGLEAEARLGELISVMPKEQGKRTDLLGSNNGTKWQDMGITKKQSHEAQEIYRHPEVVQAVAENNDIPERKHVLKEVREEKKAKKENGNGPTFNSTNDNIEWAKWSWNPVTGCRFGCKYCYARDIAMRFTGHFNPEFHEKRLSAPFNTKLSDRRKDEIGIKNVFVCSMADLFGDWVPAEWIEKILDVVKRSPQWNYLFLTKNPKRYLEFTFPENCWIGATGDTQERFTNAIDVFAQITGVTRFISAEPLKEQIAYPEEVDLDWLIIGGQSKSSGEEAMQPKWEWVENLLSESRMLGVAVYFKPNLTVRPKEYPGE